MKRITALILCVMFLFLCSCQKNEGGKATKEETQTTSLIVTVTFPEGYTVVQIAERLEENSVCSAKDFIESVQKIDELSQVYEFLGSINAENRPFAAEGYVFPDTYDFYVGESSDYALRRFLANMKSRFTDEYKNRAKELGLTMDEVLSLASIIQKEAGKESEMSKVSSVLHNRLKSDEFRSLQCDVSVEYLNNYVINSKYLSGDTEKYTELYNSYKCEGIPEGAICNPGDAAIKAALYPESTNYLFFVTDTDGNYYYAETYDEHKANCAKCGLQG